METFIETKYFGNNQSAIVSPLNTELLNADSEKFRPIDFLIGGYGSCMMNVMDKIAGESGFSLSEARTEISYEPLPDMSRLKIINIKCYIQKDDYSDEQKHVLETAATKMCPVGNSLNPEIERTYHFIYGN